MISSESIFMKISKSVSLFFLRCIISFGVGIKPWQISIEDGAFQWIPNVNVIAEEGIFSAFTTNTNVFIINLRRNIKYKKKKKNTIIQIFG